MSMIDIICIKIILYMHLSCTTILMMQKYFITSINLGYVHEAPLGNEFKVYRSDAVDPGEMVMGRKSYYIFIQKQMEC